MALLTWDGTENVLFALLMVINCFDTAGKVSRSRLMDFCSYVWFFLDSDTFNKFWHDSNNVKSYTQCHPYIKGYLKLFSLFMKKSRYPVKLKTICFALSMILWEHHLPNHWKSKWNTNHSGRRDKHMHKNEHYVCWNKRGLVNTFYMLIEA